MTEKIETINSIRRKLGFPTLENENEEGVAKMKKLTLIEVEREILIDALDDAIKLNNVDKNKIETAKILLVALKKL